MMLDESSYRNCFDLNDLEQPPPGYFDRALNEFHRRQREELLRRSAIQIWFERFVSRHVGFSSADLRLWGGIWGLCGGCYNYRIRRVGSLHADR